MSLQWIVDVINDSDDIVAVLNFNNSDNIMLIEKDNDYTVKAFSKRDDFFNSYLFNGIEVTSKGIYTSDIVYLKYRTYTVKSLELKELLSNLSFMEATVTMSRKNDEKKFYWR